MVVTVEDGNGGGCAWAKGSWRHLRRPLGSRQLSTVLATQRMVVMCGDFRLDERQLPDILEAHGAGIPASVEPLALAERALLWVMVLHLFDLLRGRVRALMVGMALLGAGFATAPA